MARGGELLDVPRLRRLPIAAEPALSCLPCYGHREVTGHTGGTAELGWMHALMLERPAVAAVVELIGKVARAFITEWKPVYIDPPPAG
jgi:hypothetical protein